jgi:predicted DNA-binding transcriptional regulator AlpA
MNQSTSQRLLNERQVADSCAISVLTLRKWRGEGRGPRYVKIGALVRYRPEDVDAWIQSHESQRVACAEVAQ